MVSNSNLLQGLMENDMRNSFELWIGLLEARIKIIRMLNSGSVQRSRNSIFKPNVEFEVWTRTSGLKFEFIARTNGK